MGAEAAARASRPPSAASWSSPSPTARAPRSTAPATSSGSTTSPRALAVLVERLRGDVDADAALLTAPFHARVQPTLYWATVLDRRRYVRQLVSQHPGIALLAAHAHPYAHDRHLLAQPGTAWNAVAEGRPLAEVDHAIARALGLDGPVARRLRWLARHVPPTIDPAVAVDAARCTAAPQSDLPPHPQSRIQWIHALAATRRALPASEHDEPWARAALRYASRHYRDTASLPPAQLRRFVGWLRGTGRRLDRRVPFPSALVAQERWWERWARDDASRRLLDDLTRRGQTQLPAPPLPGCDTPWLRIEPIRTPGELHLEGEQMRHCIFSYCPAVLAGMSTRVHPDTARAQTGLAPRSSWRLLIAAARDTGRIRADSGSLVTGHESSRGRTRPAPGRRWRAGSDR